MTLLFQQIANAESSRELILSLLAQNTPVCFKAGGPSMSPLICDGETVQIRPIKPEDLRCGAVFLYPSQGRLILHRMVRYDRTSGYARMTGDAALSGLENIHQAAFAGIAQSVLKRGKPLRLDSYYARWSGMARFALRPLRRLLLTRYHHWRTRPQAVRSVK